MPEIRLSHAEGASAPIDIEKWIESTLFSRWGWQGWVEDDCDIAFRTKAERRRILSAACFLLRVLGNNVEPETQAVVDSIIERRATHSVVAE